MGYEMQLNDPVFYDDTWYVECNECGGEYDRNTYDSSTCEECENKQVKEQRMSKVIVEVVGGVAHVVSAPAGTDVQIIDRDNEEASE
jgi:hypothetical protein